jgi:hypothetical protein
MTAPGDFPFRPKARTPVFYGSYDWHSCVEMHWLLLRLLRIAEGVIPAQEIRSVLNAHFRPVALAAEKEFITSRNGLGERPYGWGWALALVHEAQALDDPEGKKWATALQPFADAVTGCFLGWLPKATYPVRSGLHANSSFGLSLALPYACRLAASGQPSLAAAIKDTACRWYVTDAAYPAAWEPSGHDFLSPALAEAELMARLLPVGEFAPWLAAFLPGLADGTPASLFTPAVVSDSSDGQIAHLHGLNLSRAWCFRRLAETLPPGDPRIPACTEASRRHAEASLPYVTGDDYMVTHWLAAYAVLLFS